MKILFPSCILIAVIVTFFTPKQGVEESPITKCECTAAQMKVQQAFVQQNPNIDKLVEAAKKACGGND